MKRSDFIEQLHERANKELVGQRITSQEGLSGLVQIMEDMGMLPPTIEIESFKMLPTGEMSYSINEWEKEDE